MMPDILNKMMHHTDFFYDKTQPLSLILHITFSWNGNGIYIF